MPDSFWSATIIIVVSLELIRIGLSTYVLIHLLESRAFRRPGDSGDQLQSGLATVKQRAGQEFLSGSTLNALRLAMDDISAGVAGQGVDAAIEAIDSYTAHLERNRKT